VTIGELLVRLGLDPSSYTKGISKAESDTKGSTGKMGKAFDDAGSHVSKFGSVMHGVAVGVGVELTHLATEGVGKVVDILKDSETAYQDMIVSQTRLNQALKNNVPGFTDATAASSSYLAATEKNLAAGADLGFTYTEQRQALALLVGVTHDQDDAQTVMNAAMDLARLKGVDLATASDVMMKAMNGNTKGLKAYGVLVTPVTTAQDLLKKSTKDATAAQIAAAKAADLNATQTKMLADVEAMAGGQAKAYSETSVGKLAAAHEKVNEAMVKLGGIIDKIVNAVMPALADAFDNIMSAVGPVLDGIGSQMPAVISTAQGAFDTLKKALAPIMDAFGKALPGAIAFTKTAFAGIVTAFNNIKTAIMPLLNNVLKPLRETFADLTKNQNAMKGALIVLGGIVAAVVVPPMLAWAAATIAAVLPIIAIAAAVAALIVVLDKTGILDWLGKNVVPMLSAALTWLQTNVLPPLTDAFNWIVTNVLPPLGQVMGWLANNVLPALGVAFSVIWTGIQNAVHLAVGMVSTEFGILQTAIGVIQTAFGAMGTIIGAVWDGVVAAVKGAINLIIWPINMFIGALDAIQVHIPAIGVGPVHTPAFDWNGMGLPKIPTLHSGGIVPGAPGSDVLALLQAGERVIPRSQAQRGQGGGQPISIVIHNPKPEPASTSIRNTLLRLQHAGYLGGAI